MREENHTYDIYYDKEADFLEITFGEPPQKEYTEEPETGIFITREEGTDEIKGIGILTFKKKQHVLKALLQKFDLAIPLNITV